jgi:HEPN domain-containing protein
MMDSWRAWWDQALDDRETFRILQHTSQHAAACFFAQQAAEKAVKAVVTREHGRPWGHSILHLMRDLASEPPLDAGRRLDFFYVPTRYPDAFPEGSASEHFTGDDVTRAERAVEEVFEWVERQLPVRDPGSNP